MITSLYARVAAYIGHTPPPEKPRLPRPATSHQALERAMAARAALPVATDRPPIEHRATWVPMHHELEALAELTAVHGPWRAAQLMNWRR